MKISSLFRVVALALIALTFAPTLAAAADIPLMTWQRGREQQIVIAEKGKLNRQWSVTLEGNGISELPFTGSKKDARGYVVFSIDIPDDLAVGPYSVYAEEKGKEKTLIAGINLTLAKTRTAASSLKDVTWIVLIFVILTSIVSTIRARKYLYIPFKSTQVLPRITDPVLDDENFWDRLEGAPYRLRVNWLSAFKPSLLRFLLIREGELAHRLNKHFYGLSPFLGFIGGAAAAIQVEKNGGMAQSATMLFVVIACIGVLDGFAGISTTLGFWALQIFSGNVTSVRDILISLALGISWIGPSLFAALLRETIGRDFSTKSEKVTDSLRIAGVLGSGAIGALVFYFGQLLLQSIIYIERPQLEVTWVHALIIGVALVIRGFADYVAVNSPTNLEMRDESFFMARVISPITSLFVAISVLSFTFIWTNSASKAFFVAVIFSLPYLFSFIRFAKNERLSIERYPRNLLLEAALLGATTFVIFKFISISPLLLEKQVELLLLSVGIAPAIHAVLSAIYSSNEDKFSFDENSEIIKP